MNSHARRFISAFLMVAFVGATALQQATIVQAAESTGQIRGSLVDENGIPLAGYKVRVRDASGTSFDSAATASDGVFEIGDLAAGTYTYEIVDPNGMVISIRIPPVNLVAGGVVTQPIAIVPRKKRPGGAPMMGKAARIAWPIVAVVVIGGALVIANNNNDNNPPSMTPGGP